jgi:SAM-dependent methyltransferase
MDDAETVRTARFWDRIAEWYARQPIADEAAYTGKLEVTRGYLRPDMEVLEIGCGTGGTAIAHAPHVKHIRAIDISAKMIAIAMTKAATAEAKNVDFEQASIDELNVADGSLDAVLALGILHLLNNRAQSSIRSTGCSSRAGCLSAARRAWGTGCRISASSSRSLRPVSGRDQTRQHVHHPLICINATTQNDLPNSFLSGGCSCIGRSSNRSKSASKIERISSIE